LVYSTAGVLELKVDWLGKRGRLASDISSVKREAWKTALAVFFGVLAVHFCWHWIAKTRESAFLLLGKSIGIAVIVYFMSRTDWFD
jgi:hypothetical protein